MLISLTTNLPRYSIERRLGAAQLGVFAAVASFVTMAQMVMNALGQSATPRLAMLFSSGDLHRFKNLAAWMVALAAGLGFAGILGAMLVGPFVLALLYRPEFAAYNRLLIGMMSAGALFYISGALGYVNTSTRAFRVQLPLYGVTAGVCGLSAMLLVPLIGLAGAAASLALAAAVQIAGQLLILRSALVAAESRP
jgi:O-antigen/teichoic acid export membrane protein